VKGGAILLSAGLCYAVLVLWVEQRWAWGLFQVSVWALAGWCTVRLQHPRPSFLLAPLAAAAIWPLLQLAFGVSISPGPTCEQALDWFTFVAVFVVSGELFRDRRGLRIFLSAACLFGMLIGAAGTFQKYSSGGKIFWLFPSGFDSDVIGPFVNRNQFAAWIELLLPPALYLAARERRVRPLYACAAACMFGAVVASASRAGFVLACGEILAVGVALALRQSAPRKALAFRTIQVAVLGLIAASIAGWHGLETRLETTGLEALRVDAAKASFQMIKSRPWTGSGLGTWSIVYPRYAGFDAGLTVNQAHDDWLQWAAEGGLPFVLLLAIFALLLSKRAIPSIYGIGTVAFLLHASLDYPMQQRPALAAWFFAMAGATAARSGGLARGR